MRGVLLALLCACLGCASTRVVPATAPLDEASVARADADLLAGCYDCLVRARDRYRALATGPHRAALLPRVFEAELLLALRGRELGLPGGDMAERLGQLAAELPPELEAPRYVELVGRIPPEPVGTPRAARLAFVRANGSLLRERADLLAWIASGSLRPFVREYVSFAVMCAAGVRGVPGPKPALDASTLLLYRAGACEGERDAVLLAGVRDAVPEFHDASFVLAQIHLATAALGVESPAKVLAASSDAYTRFPDAPGVTFVSGSVRQVMGDCDGALRHYDETIALASGHEDAWLGRTACLSHLLRHAEAIDSATRIVEMNLDTRRDAYYWRAWNQHRLRDLAAARADIERAKRSGFTLEIRVLAGIIEYDQDDLDASEADMRAARSLSSGRSCTASWYLGLVHFRRSAWANAGTDFEAAMTCYGQNIRQAEAALAALEASDFEPDFRALREAALKKAMIEDTRQQHAAAMNAAKGFANAGQFEKAVPLGMFAAQDPALAEDVKVLNEFLAARAPGAPPPQAR